MIKENFNKLLLTFLILYFSVVMLIVLKWRGEAEAFKWIIGIAGSLVGALLMMMRNDTPLADKPQPVQIHLPPGALQIPPVVKADNNAPQPNP